MSKGREGTGAGSTVTIILLIIIVAVLGWLFYLRSNNLIQVDGFANNNASINQGNTNQNQNSNLNKW